MKTNKKWLFYPIIGTILLASYFIWSINKEKVDIIQVNGISTFKPISSENEDNFLLFYPADSRVSQEYTIVKEVDKTGEVVRQYEVIDKDFRRMIVHQKPNHIDQLYISFLGEATIDNYFFTYDINNRLFNKVTLDYFDYRVGVDHIRHYGNHTLFQTIVSHKTGDQNTQPKTYDFNVSISDYTENNSFETEYGYAPKWTPLLEFNNKLIYATAGKVYDNDIIENIGIGLIDLSKQQVYYEMFNPYNTDFFPLYATEDHAYILGNSGELYVYDKSFNYKTSKPFKNLPEQDWYYNEEYPPLLINEHTILTSVYREKQGSIVGLLELEPEPIFKPLEKNYIKPNYFYTFLYQDITNGEIYILQRNNNDEYLLVINNETFELKERLPIDYGHLLDFVVRI